MSSTSSSEETPKTRSATETLASRYRHLFVLPSYPTLILYGAVASFTLSLISRGTNGIIAFIPAFVVLLLSATTISSALRIADRRTIATFRRAQALLFAAELLWLLIAGIGASFALASGSSYPLTNAILFGAFVCAGFEFLVIQGVFRKNVALSLPLASLHPAATLVVLRLPELTAHFDVLAASGGFVAFAILFAFPLILSRRKISLGDDALSLFQAFMKTWTSGDADALEKIISDHAEKVEVVTKVLDFRTATGDTYVVLPGVHPGPFHPVGSYDLPAVISRSFKDLGPAMTFHRPGGHERNLVTREETLKYSLGVSKLASSIETVQDEALMRGPVYETVGRASVSASGFDNDLITTISFAPLGSDDIDATVEEKLARSASVTGFDLSIVDAHNSIAPDLQSPDVEDPGWRRLFASVKGTAGGSFRVAYAHSSEISFVGRSDLTDGGIALLMLEKAGVKSALVLADANNSVPGLKSAVATALTATGFQLIELCTSDSHNLAARGLTVNRGYEALGEATPSSEIADAVASLAKLAEPRLEKAEYGSSTMRSEVRVFGSKALEEFAAITQASSKLARAYFGPGAISIAVLLFLSLVF